MATIRCDTGKNLLDQEFQHYGITSISNEVNFRKQMTKWVKSSLRHDEPIFDSFGNDSLRDLQLGKGRKIRHHH